MLEGAYRITRLIGEGGMGAVYEAVQLRLNKRVAVKLMARDLAANREALARFHREAEITSHLGHPHLVTVVDFGQAESGEPYLVMEYLEGEDLDHRLRRVGRMPIEAVVHVVRQVASALSAAHGQGIVHRDLKPGNVFLLQIPGEPDFVKVLDFGISKMKAARTQLTSASAVMGTPNYMSPEQATGMLDEIDHRADQWALACIAWEMLLGRGPFVADDAAALLYQIINLDPHPLAPRVPGLPPAVESVLRRALSKRPADRFPSIREFSRAFETAAFGRPADATPAPVLVSARAVSRRDHRVRREAGSEHTRAAARRPSAAGRSQARGRCVAIRRRLGSRDAVELDQADPCHRCTCEGVGAVSDGAVESDQADLCRRRSGRGAFAARGVPVVPFEPRAQTSGPPARPTPSLHRCHNRQHLRWSRRNPQKPSQPKPAQAPPDRSTRSGSTLHRRRVQQSQSHGETNHHDPRPHGTKPSGNCSRSYDHVCNRTSSCSRFSRKPRR